MSKKFNKIINCIRNESENTFIIHKKNSINLSDEISIKKNSLKAISILIATIVASGGYYGIYSFNKLLNELEEINLKLQRSEITNNNLIQKTEKLKNENNNLENKNNTLENNFSNMIQKANELENKINEINGVKDELYDTLDEMSGIGHYYKENLISETKEPKEKIFTSLIYTPYEKTSSIEITFESIENIVDKNSIEFVSVADDMKTTLADRKSDLESKILDGVTIPSLWPTNGQISSVFDKRINPIHGGFEFHKGIDIAVPNGSPVYATAGGKIVKSEYSNSYGNYIIIDHENEYKTLYAHNSKLIAKNGDYVKAGEQIAYSGETGNVTGPHLHYEIIENGKNIDPEIFLP